MGDENLYGEYKHLKCDYLEIKNLKHKASGFPMNDYLSLIANPDEIVITPFPRKGME